MTMFFRTQPTRPPRARRTAVVTVPFAPRASALAIRFSVCINSIIRLYGLECRGKGVGHWIRRNLSVTKCQVNNRYTGQLYEGQGRGIVNPPGGDNPQERVFDSGARLRVGWCGSTRFTRGL